MQDPLVSYFPQNYLTSWLEVIQDVATKKPLNNTTLIADCYHHVSSSTLIGKSVCPECRAPIVNCITDHHVVKLEGFILQIQNSAHETLARLAHELCEESPPLAPPLLSPLTLPARFECVQPWHKVPKSNKFLRSSAAWESSTPNSFFHTLQVNERRDKAPEIILTCRSKYTEEFNRYLMLSGFSGPMPGVFKAQTLLELDFSLNLIADYAELAEFSLLKQLVTRHKTRLASSIMQTLLAPLRRRSSNSPPISPAPVPSDSLKDAVTTSLLENAVILIPCGHSVNEAWAHRLAKCTVPNCGAGVTHYVPNTVLRSIVEFVRQAYTSVFIRIPESTPLVPEDPLPPIPFPGPAARFVYGNGGEWCVVVPGLQATRCRQMTLYSDNTDALIYAVEVRGYEKGLIALIITCREQYKDVYEKYLAHFGIEMDGPSRSCMARLSRELDWALRFVMDHNRLPEAAFRRLEYFKQARTWRLLGE